MSELLLVIGNRNYSSWSLRAWLALEQTGLPFRTEQIWFDEDADRRRRLSHSPTGRVPVLRHGDITVWDSLAIGEYLAEVAPQAGLWPEASAARARARSLCAEMHSGFQALRENLPMNIRGRARGHAASAAVDKDITRLTSLWTETRREFGRGGPFLFGDRSLADAFYAPVACRFRTYSVSLKGEAAAWAEAVLNLPAMRAWTSDAETEGHAEPGYDALLQRHG